MQEAYEGRQEPEASQRAARTEQADQERRLIFPAREGLEVRQNESDAVAVLAHRLPAEI